MRGTAIITRDSISLENVTMLPSGRAIAAKFREIWIINIYTSSGKARKQDRENFYNNEVPYIIATAGDHILLGGDYLNEPQEPALTPANQKPLRWGDGARRKPSSGLITTHIPRYSV